MVIVEGIVQLLLYDRPPLLLSIQAGVLVPRIRSQFLGFPLKNLSHAVLL